MASQAEQVTIDRIPEAFHGTFMPTGLYWPGDWRAAKRAAIAADIRTHRLPMSPPELFA
jgi:hypothetical protein